MKLNHYQYQRLAIRLPIAGLQADVHRGSDEIRLRCPSVSLKLIHYQYQRLAIRLRFAGLQAAIHRGSDEISTKKWGIFTKLIPYSELGQIIENSKILEFIYPSHPSPAECPRELLVFAGLCGLLRRLPVLRAAVRKEQI